MDSLVPFALEDCDHPTRSPAMTWTKEDQMPGILLEHIFENPKVPTKEISIMLVASGDSSR